MTTALADALQAAGVVPPTSEAEETSTPKKNGNGKNKKKSKRGKWESAKAGTPATINWSHEIGRVTLSIGQFKLGPAQTKRGYYYAQIFTRDHEPNSIRIDFSTNLEEGVVPVYSQDGNFVDCGTKPIPSLVVPVTWQKGKGVARVPHTRVKGKDNADLILALPGGQFINLQVSILTRGGVFYICIQELYAGQIVQVPDINDYALHYKTVEVAGRHYIVTPLWPEFAYPNSDYLRDVMPSMGPKFVQLAASAGGFITPDELETPAWDPPAYPTMKGWPMGAVVLWFNAIVGAKALCADGKVAYIPIGRIPGEGSVSAMKDGDFPILYPRQALVLRHSDEGAKGRIATEIEPLEVADAAD
jgi:hypothetical protein